MIRLSTEFNDMTQLPSPMNSRLCKVAICIPKTAAREPGYLILPAIWDGVKFIWRGMEILTLNMEIEMCKSMSENPYIIGWKYLISATSELV